MSEKQPILSQPVGYNNFQAEQVQWMERPTAAPGCPPGLEYLTLVDQLLIHQQVELLQVFTGWEVNNRYAIKNSMGQQVYFAVEETDMCMRQCCGHHRGFIIHVFDNMNQEVMRIQREFKCCAGCCWCANTDCIAYEVSVEAPVGQIIGYVRQSQSAWKPKYTVKDALGNDVFDIQGPCCPCQTICCTSDVDFRLVTPEGRNEIGKVTKQWTGWVREMFTRADNFGVQFPADLDVKMKATLLGAVLLIDFMYFERRKKKR